MTQETKHPELTLQLKKLVEELQKLGKDIEKVTNFPWEVTFSFPGNTSAVVVKRVCTMDIICSGMHLLVVLGR